MRTGLLAVVAATLLLGACGTTDAAPGVASVGGAQTSAATPDAQLSMEERGRKFAQCMRDNGVDMADPDPNATGGGRFGGGNVDRNSPAFQKAIDACRSLLPNGGDLAKANPELLEQARQYAQCMRENGVNVPDPDPDKPFVGMGGANIDRNSPEVKKAMETCQDKRPKRRDR
jgi:hypothetical protein